MTEPRLTHVDETGAARMVDVSEKAVTTRVATAAGRVLVSPEVVALLRGTGVPKGDAVAVARIAGIAGAKRTPDLVPLCHPIALHGVTVDLEVTDEAVEITATARTADRTGVEMEALTSVAVAGLTMIDMVKAVDPRASDHRRPAAGQERREERGAGLDERAPRERARRRRHRVQPRLLRRLRGPQRPRPGRGLTTLGFAVDGPRVLPDDVDQLESALREAVDGGVDVVLTTGGTGLSPTDVTPEATGRVLEREAPGLAEAVRRYGVGERGADLGALPRPRRHGGRTLIVNLPGSTGGVRDGLAVLGPLLPHIVSQLRGGDHDRPA